MAEKALAITASLLRRLRSNRGGPSPVFPGIELQRDEPEPYFPAPLRSDKNDVVETIADQSRGSARRLLRDRYVDDRGYLQSRSPFFLKAPPWEHLDTGYSSLHYSRFGRWLSPDRPRMTEEGALWEDMHHFVDYLTCKDVPLAFELNEMLLGQPKEALHQFGMLVRLLNRQLCNHEVLGRGYIFTKEPVLSPSVLVGRLVLNKKVPELKKGMQYLWMLNRGYVMYQRDNIRGVDLERLQRSCLMLTEAASLLHHSAGWSEIHFVEILKEFAIFDPMMAAHLHHLSGPFILAALISNHKRAIQRFLDLMRRMSVKPTVMALMNELGCHPDRLLHPDEDVFQSFVAWLPMMEMLGYDSMKGLQLCSTLFVIWEEMNIELVAFLDRLEILKTHCPKAFENALMNFAEVNEEDCRHSSLYQMIINPDKVVQRMAVIPGRYSDVLNGLPALLVSDLDMDAVVTGLDRLCALSPDVTLMGPFSIERLLQWRPELIGTSEIVKMVDQAKKVIDALTAEETEIMTKEQPFSNLLEAAEKLHAVVQYLEDAGLEVDAIDRLILEKIDRIRSWRRHASIPPEIIPYMNAASISDLASWLQLSGEHQEQQEERLFLLFGISPGPIFQNLSQMPELIQNEKLEVALSAARCLKVTKLDMRNENFRTADRLLSVLIQTLESIRAIPAVNEEAVLHTLERLADWKLVTNDADVMPTQLVQFCILCIEHPGTWTQFERLIGMIHHPALEELRPLELQKMKMEAFVCILKSPEIFLIPELWDMMITHLDRHQWTFAGLDLDTVTTTEPNLLMHTIQRKWTEECKRDVSALIQKLQQKPETIRRRGKSIAAILET